LDKRIERGYATESFIVIASRTSVIALTSLSSNWITTSVCVGTHKLIEDQPCHLKVRKLVGLLSERVCIHPASANHLHRHPIEYHKLDVSIVSIKDSGREWRLGDLQMPWADEIVNWVEG
jgi:hypothetical protein